MTNTGEVVSDRSMVQIRSVLFNITFYVNMLIWMLAILPTLLLPRMVFMRSARAWAYSCLWLQKVICGTRYEFRGLDRLPPGGFLVACKHQSMWETFALFCVFDDPAFVMKHELRWVPFYGWYTWKSQAVPVKRGGGAASLRQMNALAATQAKAGRQIVIFPEGTRTSAGTKPSYKYGIAHMYEQMGMACVPVALNSGVFWPRRRFLRYPGTIVVEILETIPAGLDRETFFTVMQTRIEEASDKLLAAAKDETQDKSRL